METDFLNFRETGEYFNSNLYQNDMLEDSQSSLLDAMGDAYSTHNSDYWEQDLEQELNGDIALIPMSGCIDSISKLSNSPPSKDFHRMFTDLQDHLVSIENADNDVLDLRIPDHNLTVDMFECLPDTDEELKHKIKVPPVGGGKNLELLKAVVKKEMKIESDDDIDGNFDLTSYVNGETVKAESTTDEDSSSDESEPEEAEDAPKKPDKFIKSSCHQEIKIKSENDSDDDCIDIETVSDQMPVLEARDLTSLLEQFEASEAVNPKKTKSPEQKQNSPEKTAEKPRKTSAAEPKKPPETISDELIQKLKASGLKKQISVIPAIPKKTKRESAKIKQKPAPMKSPDNQAIQKPPAVVINAIKTTLNNRCAKNAALSENSCGSDTTTSENSVHFDHDYCRSPQEPKSAKDTHNRIKTALLKQKITSDGKNRLVKSSDGKIMVSLLKNNRNNAPLNRNTIVSTLNANDEQIQNIIIDSKNVKASAETFNKKRKLNLEEYKKLRGEVIKSRSTDNSRATSPCSSPKNDSTQDKIKLHQELMMKMASEILKTPVKSKTTSELTLEVFVPPDAVKKPCQEPKCEPEPAAEVAVKATQYEMKTIVSIGVNTLESMKRKTPGNVLPSVVKGTKLNELTPILQNVSNKINSNSLIANITATLLQQNPSKTNDQNKITEIIEHGEDKTVIALDVNRVRPLTKNVETQTDDCQLEKSGRSSSASSIASLNLKATTRRKTYRTNSTHSVSSSVGSRSKSRSRSRSRSDSVSSESSYSSSSSCSRSRSRSVSPDRRYSSHMSRSRHQYNRTRRRSRSNGYRDSYKRSRSPFQTSWKRRRSKESAERDRQREVEERRVIYVGNIEDGMTKAELRRRFQRFGPITNVSVHFREHGDNYGFVTFAYKVDAYEAVENGNDDPDQPKYDISFGGRRAFCKTRYSDLDNIEDEVANPLLFRKEEDTFDILLREVQAKLLRKKKV